MYISKVSKGVSFNGMTVTLKVGQKTASEELVAMYPDFFEKAVETVQPVQEQPTIVIEDKVESITDTMDEVVISEPAQPEQQEQKTSVKAKKGLFGFGSK